MRHVCRDCKYYDTCGDWLRTEPCKGKEEVSVLARQLFVRLERDLVFRKGNYLILNDGRFLGEFQAESDKEAVEKFTEMYPEAVKLL